MDGKLEQHRRTWDHLGEIDPLWAILSSPGKRGRHWDLEPFFGKGRREVDGLLRTISARFPDVARGCALDFGCGVGRLTRSLAEHFDRAIGIDIAASMVQLARQLNADRPNCEFILNEADDLRVIPSGSVDVVVAALVLQHIPPAYAEGYVREFVRVLSPSGLAVFQAIDRPGRSISGRLSQWVPATVHEAYRRIRYGRERIRIYRFPAARVHAAVREAGGRVLGQDALEDPTGRWEKAQYFVSQSAAAPEPQGR